MQKSKEGHDYIQGEFSSRVKSEDENGNTFMIGSVSYKESKLTMSNHGTENEVLSPLSYFSLVFFFSSPYYKKSTVYFDN